MANISPRTSLGRDVFFIDGLLPDLFTLTSALPANAEIHLIDATQDGLELMALTLQGESGIDAIHIFSHGSAGELLLGSTTLSSYNINSYAATLSQIGSSLSPSGDILFYGCNVGAGDEGSAFVESVARLTQADVAASDDVTGSAALGGDWVLEVKSGVIESVVPVAGDELKLYDHTLGSVDDYILAKMSLVAYYDDPAHPNEKEPSKQLVINAWEELKADGWKILENSGGNNWRLTDSPKNPTFEDTFFWGFSSGFSATVFGKGNDIVIAYRGTNAANDFIGADAAVASLVPNAWDTQFTYALKVAQTIKEAFGNSKITVTGHSLGGSLAQVASQMFEFSGATFDPAGAENLIDGWDFHNNAGKMGIVSDGKGVPVDFTNYLVEASPISQIPGFTNDHLGNTETLKQGELRDFLDHYAENHPVKALLGIMDTGLTLAALKGIDYVFYSHAMLGILEFMRQKGEDDKISYSGTSTANTISANNSSNVIDGSDGNDTISGNGGNDTIDGGSGNDTAVFSDNFADYTISLDKNSLVFTVTDSVSGRDGTDQLTHVEAFAFGDGTWQAGDACTVVNGSYRNEYLYGNDLDNKLLGEGGNDVLEGKKGNDTIDGGSGFDTVIFTGTYAEYTITRNADQASFTITDQIAGRDGTDLVSGVEQYRFAYDDVRDAAHLTENAGGGTGTGGGGITVSANRLSSSTMMSFGHTMGEWNNYVAFAALRADGSVVTWGDSQHGGDSSVVSSKLNGDMDVVQVFSTNYAFAASREDGSVVTWGDGSYGGNSSTVADKLNGDVDVVQVFSTDSAFGALLEDGSVVTWGDSRGGGDSSAVSSKLTGDVDVVQVFSASSAFAALLEDGSVVTWGLGRSGGDSSVVSIKLDGTVDVVQVFSTREAFAALRADGSVVTWGYGISGGDSSAVSSELTGDVDVVQVFSTHHAFAALRRDGSVVTWGNSPYGGDCSSVADKLHDVVAISDIYSNDSQDRIFSGTDANDNFTGSYASDILWGNSGNDILAAMGGNDLAFGGNGNDLFIGGEGEGDDTYVGGEGVDSVKYSSALAGITVDLAEGTACSTDGNNAAAIGNDLLIDIEQVTAGNFNDILIGNASANSLEGGTGDDWLQGSEGADTLDGGPGSDTGDYSDKAVALMVTLNGAGDASVMVGGVTEDTIRNIENLIGGSGNDIFIGDIANNLFRGGAGNDTLDGGIGLDTVDYSDKTGPVSVTLHGSVDTLVTVGGVAEDTIRNIENLIGGSGNDTFIGDAMANNFSGGEGDDTLQGGAGNDTLNGGFDDDTVLFSGNLAEYSISYDFKNKTYTVTDLVSDRDGSDFVTRAEFFQFANGLHPVADLIDIVPPYLQAITPSAYATNVAFGSDIVFTFTEPVQAGTGSVLLQKGGVTVMMIDVTDTAQVSFNGSTLTINPSVNFAFDSEYTVSIGAGAIADLAGNSYPSTETYDLTTAAASSVHDISGSVTFWKTGAAITDVSSTFASDSMTTGTDGLYHHLGMPDGTHTMTSAKVAGTAESNAIKANDALAALKIAVGMNPNADGSAVSPYQYLAADVNHDGQVKAADALNILKMAVKLSTAPEKEWLFVPDSVGSEAMSRTNVVWPDNPISVTLDMDQELHLIGIVKGDVSGSWVA